MLQCRKLKKPNWCFQFLSYITQWLNGKYCDFMGPTVRHSRPLFLSTVTSFLFSSFLSFLLQAGFFQLLLFFFFFFTAGFFHLLLSFSFSCFFCIFFLSSSWLGSFIFCYFFFLFSFLSFFFTLVSFLLFLHAMMAEMVEGFDFSCDLSFNRVKVCFWGFDFKAFIFFFLIFFFIFLSSSDAL